MSKIIFWNEVVGFEGIYDVSDQGTVRVAKTGKIRKLKCDPDGYLKITLTKNRVKITKSVHRLVAIAFIENPKNKLQVNHKDGNRSNNILSNLEWSTASENQLHARTLLTRKSGSIPIIGTDKDGNTVEYKSILEAATHLAKNDRAAQNIRKVLKGKTTLAYGYSWRYKNPERQADIMRSVDMTGMIPVPGYEELYLIDESGKIYSKKYKRLMTQSLTNGYMTVNLQRKQFFVHRLVALTFIPLIEGKNIVNHKNGNKLNNNVNNLEWCTSSENNLHAYETVRA